jgi:hypothetical protein
MGVINATTRIISCHEENKYDQAGHLSCISEPPFFWLLFFFGHFATLNKTTLPRVFLKVVRVKRTVLASRCAHFSSLLSSGWRMDTKAGAVVISLDNEVTAVYRGCCLHGRASSTALPPPPTTTRAALSRLRSTSVLLHTDLLLPGIEVINDWLFSMSLPG